MAVVVERARPEDRTEAERLLAEYHASEGLPPRRERIAWAVEQQLEGRFPGLLVVAWDKRTVVGVALAVYQPSSELGRVLVVHDLYVVPAARRKGVGKALATKILEEARAMRMDHVDLEIMPGNEAAIAFWSALGFRASERTVHRRAITQQ